MPLRVINNISIAFPKLAVHVLNNRFSAYSIKLRYIPKNIFLYAILLRRIPILSSQGQSKFYVCDTLLHIY